MIARLRVRAGSLFYIAAEQIVSVNQLLLRIKGNSQQYTFYIANPENQQYIELGQLDTRYLSREVADGLIHLKKKTGFIYIYCQL